MEKNELNNYTVYCEISRVLIDIGDLQQAKTIMRKCMVTADQDS